MTSKVSTMLMNITVSLD